jgi:methylmalonyl-CoA mutase N-terminal domain/subunit
VEWLTDELERQADAIFARLDEWGQGSMLEGVLAGIDSNWFQAEIAEAAYSFQRDLATGRKVQVGVNRFVESGGDDAVNLLAIGPDVEQAQCKRLAEVRRHRSPGAVDDALAGVRQAASDPTTNVMPAIIEAVQAYATIGEIMAAMADVFGRYVERAAL